MVIFAQKMLQTHKYLKCHSSPGRFVSCSEFGMCPHKKLNDRVNSQQFIKIHIFCSTTTNEIRNGQNIHRSQNIVKS